MIKGSNYNRSFEFQASSQIMKIQQGLEIRCFWFQKKTVQLKTALREVYTYVLRGFFFSKTVYLQGFQPESVYLKVTVMQYSVHSWVFLQYLLCSMYFLICKMLPSLQPLTTGLKWVWVLYKIVSPCVLVNYTIGHQVIRKMIHFYLYFLSFYGAPA